MNLRKAITIMLMSSLMTACHLVPDSVIPVRTVKYHLANSKNTLLIFIPGIADDEMTFKTQGLLQEVSQHDLAVDIISAHVHLGYVLDETFVERVKEDLIEPAKAQGYKNIWLVGISLGAFVGLNYMKARPDDLTGMLLLGPYLGESADINVIRQAGGIQAWMPNEVDTLPKTLKLWEWYQQQANSNGLKNIYLGYGKEDRLKDGIEQFRQLLPKENIHMVDGGHSWRAWLQLWKRFLDDGLFR